MFGRTWATVLISDASLKFHVIVPDPVSEDMFLDVLFLKGGALLFHFFSCTQILKKKCAFSVCVSQFYWGKFCL